MCYSLLPRISFVVGFQDVSLLLLCRPLEISVADCQLSDLFFERLQFTLLPPIPPPAASESEGGREAREARERERAVVWIGVDRGRGFCEIIDHARSRERMLRFERDKLRERMMRMPGMRKGFALWSRQGSSCLYLGNALKRI